MKFTITKNSLKISADSLMRRAGYGFIRSHHTGKESYVKRITRDFYPRFHIYVDENAEELTFNIHLDQKEASYAGSHAHSGEYDGDLVMQEARQLKQNLLNIINSEASQVAAIKTEKKSWWQKIFG